MQSVLFKFVLNILLAVTFLFLMDDKSFLGITFHEIAGLVICLAFILHKALNWNFIKEATIRLFGKIPGKMRVNYILDVLLLIGFTLIIISGMAIAKTIDFSWLGFEKGGGRIWRVMHTSISMIVLMIAGIHIGLHWDWVLARFKKSNSRGI